MLGASSILVRISVPWLMKHTWENKTQISHSCNTSDNQIFMPAHAHTPAHHHMWPGRHHHSLRLMENSFCPLNSKIHVHISPFPPASTFFFTTAWRTKTKMKHYTGVPEHLFYTGLNSLEELEIGWCCKNEKWVGLPRKMYTNCLPWAAFLPLLALKAIVLPLQNREKRRVDSDFSFIFML